MDFVILRNSTRICSRKRASKLLSGSSINNTFESVTMARAMATRCCCPPLKSVAGRSSSPSS